VDFAAETLFKLPRMSKKTKVLVAFATCFVLLASAGSAFGRALSRSESSLLRAINATRTARGLAPLRLDRRLERAARGHSSDMLRRGYFAHGSLAARMQASHARGPLFGEDLAWGPADPEWVVSQWLASPEHRANLLSASYSRVGVGDLVGAFQGFAGAHVVTADFAG
jgi:uncharacterized protein YkwD